jgi:hypothetical protein
LKDSRSTGLHDSLTLEHAIWRISLIINTLLRPVLLNPLSGSGLGTRTLVRQLSRPHPGAQALKKRRTPHKKTVPSAQVSKIGGGLDNARASRCRPPPGIDYLAAF